MRVEELLLAEPREGLPDRGHARGQVHVPPAQAEEFTPAHPRQNRRQVQGVIPRGPLRFGEEEADQLLVPDADLASAQFRRVGYLGWVARQQSPLHGVAQDLPEDSVVFVDGVRVHPLLEFGAQVALDRWALSRSRGTCPGRVVP